MSDGEKMILSDAIQCAINTERENIELKRHINFLYGLCGLLSACIVVMFFG